MKANTKPNKIENYLKNKNMNENQLKSIQLIFESFKCTLLADLSYTCYDKLPYICVCGNHSSTTVYHLKEGKLCNLCRGSKIRKKKQLSFDYIFNFFKENNCELISKTYKNAHEKLHYKCSCGEHSTIEFNSFKYGNRCKTCGIKKRSKNNSGANHVNWNPNRDEINLRRKTQIASHNFLKRTFNNKIKHKFEILGYNHDDLMKHITSFDSWNQIKNKAWDFDHIFPVSAFVKQGILDMKIINALDNMQPLLREDNLKKSNKYNIHEFKNWLQIKGIKI